MATLENRYVLDIDLKNKTMAIAKFKQADSATSVLEINLLDNGIAVDVTGQTIAFNFQRSDGTIVIQDITNGVSIINALTGNFQCVLQSNTLSVAGPVNCEIAFSSGSKVLSTASFNFNVDSSIGVLSVNYITSINNILIAWQAAFDLAETERETAFAGMVHIDANLELSTARGGQTDLNTRLNKSDALLAEKASNDYVNTLMANITDGSPKELFYSIVALNIKYPTGAAGPMLVFDSSFVDGAHSMFWNGSAWIDIGIYQGSKEHKPIVPNVYEWKENNIISVYSTNADPNYILDAVSNTYKQIAVESITLDQVFSLVYYDLTSTTAQLHLIKIDNWAALTTNFFANPNNVIIALKQGSIRVCNYLRNHKYNKYIVTNKSFYINDNKVFVSSSAFLISSAIETNNQPFVLIPENTDPGISLPDFSVLVLNLVSGIPVFEIYSWNGGTNLYNSDISSNENIIPVAYKHSDGVVRLFNKNDSFENVYISKSFYQENGLVKHDNIFIIGNLNANGVQWQSIAADTAGITLQNGQVLVLNLMTLTITIENWNVANVEPMYYSNPSCRVLAYKFGDIIQLNYENNNVIEGIIKEISSLKSAASTTNASNSDLTGCIVSANTAPNMSVQVASGSINGVTVSPVSLTIETLSADIPVTQSLTLTSAWQILNSEFANCPYRIPRNIVVKDLSNHVLVLGTDYNIGDWGDNIKVIMGLNTTSQVTVSFGVPVCRIDTILVDTTTGALSVKKGYESNNNPTKMVNKIPIGKLRLANICLFWDTTSIQTSSIFNCSGINVDGYTKDDLTNLKYKKEHFGNKLYKFYSQIAMLADTTSLLKRTLPINIGILGDSTVANNQMELVDENGVVQGWTCVFADKVHVNYPDAEVILYSVDGAGAITEFRNYPSQNGSNIKIHVYNYAQGGHSLSQLMHDGDGHYDMNGANKYSVLYANGVPNYHDLFFIARTNIMLTDLTSLKGNYYSIYTSAPYSLALHPQVDYNDVANGQNYIIADNIKCYVAELERIYSNLTAQGAEVVFVSDTPDSIKKDYGTLYESNIHLQSEKMFEVAREHNCIFIDLYPIFRNIEQITGISVDLVRLPEGNIHPSIYTHNIMGNNVAEVIANSIV